MTSRMAVVVAVQMVMIMVDPVGRQSRLAAFPFQVYQVGIHETETRSDARFHYINSIRPDGK